MRHPIILDLGAPNSSKLAGMSIQSQEGLRKQRLPTGTDLPRLLLLADARIHWQDLARHCHLALLLLKRVGLVRKSCCSVIYRLSVETATKWAISLNLCKARPQILSNLPTNCSAPLVCLDEEPSPEKFRAGLYDPSGREHHRNRNQGRRRANLHICSPTLAKDRQGRIATFRTSGHKTIPGHTLPTIRIFVLICNGALLP